METAGVEVGTDTGTCTDSLQSAGSIYESVRGVVQKKDLSCIAPHTALPKR